VRSDQWASGLKVRGALDVQTVYELGPGDTLEIWVLDSPEISDRQYRVNGNGMVRIPMLGQVPVAGMSTTQLEDALLEDLKAHYLHPDVKVSVAEYRSHPVTVLGAVQNPGVHRLNGPSSLIEVLGTAGGVSEGAGYELVLKRRRDQGPIHHDEAQNTADDDFSTLEVPLNELFEGTTPAANLLVRPHDVVFVPQAEVVYVMGAVNRSGGFALRRSERATALTALAMAEGLTGVAKPRKAMILRPSDGGAPTQIPVDVKGILEGKEEDITLSTSDILYVPASTTKKVAQRALEISVAVATSVAIWRLGGR
jgi:polysaccharide export outer membrane protein